MPKENISPQVTVLPLVTDGRRSTRLRLQIPLFIRARDSQGEQFLELGKTLDIRVIRQQEAGDTFLIALDFISPID